MDQARGHRDRTYQEGFLGDRTFRVSITGGLSLCDDSEFLPENPPAAQPGHGRAARPPLVVSMVSKGLTAADQVHR